MTGIYIHIPFCKQACHYCDFHFSTSMRYREEMMQALIQEIHLKHAHLQDRSVSSIYLGGGTPSLCSPDDINRLYHAIGQYSCLDNCNEITLEANPDDLTKEYLSDLHAYTPITRLSIGIQSFFDSDLTFMNRAHSAKEAKQCIEWAKQKGFSELTIDLIYGAPTTTQAMWEENIRIATSLQLPHLSCYALTIEKGTVLHKYIEKGMLSPLNDERVIRQYDILMDAAEQAKYVHYEISNFAKDERFAIHNSSYWQGKPYVGIGPSAHSYDGLRKRSWNVAHNAKYMRSISAQIIPETFEILSDDSRYNEYVMTGIRTCWGCQPAIIADKFGTDRLHHFTQQIIQTTQRGWIHWDEAHHSYVLTRAGKHLADRVAGALFL